jgi:hypothetical protein
MDGQKTRKTAEVRKTPLKIQTDLWKKVRVLDSEVSDADELAIDDDFECGGDPYNSTGQHVILELTQDDSE